MVYERLPGFSIDVERLADQLLNTILPNFEITNQGQSFGGWSVLSHNGDYREGWEAGTKAYRENDGQWSIDQRKLREMGYVNDSFQAKPTEICTGYLNDVMKQIVALKLCPRRARITRLNPQTQTTWHRDALSNHYAVRLHVPIITNPNAKFVTESGAAHLPADGSAYLVYVNRMHRAENLGDSARYHLLMQVWDTRSLSKYHRYAPNLMNAAVPRSSPLDLYQ